MPLPIVTDPSTGIIGEGTILNVLPSFTPVAMITKIGITGIEADEIDVSTMNSGGFKQNIRGLKDAKEVTLELVYQRSTTAQLYTYYAGGNYEWEVVAPDGFIYQFTGFVKKIGIEIPHNDKITQSVTIRVVAQPVVGNTVYKAAIASNSSGSVNFYFSTAITSGAGFSNANFTISKGGLHPATGFFYETAGLIQVIFSDLANQLSAGLTWALNGGPAGIVYPVSGKLIAAPL